MSELRAIALDGFQRAEARLLAAGSRIAAGELSPEAMVEQVAASTDVKVQISALKAALELEETVIDLLV